MKKKLSSSKKNKKDVGVFCVGFRGYRVTVEGLIWSIKHQKFLKSWSCGKYRQVALWKNEKRNPKFVHRLVAEALIPNPDKKQYVKHKDGDTSNNNVNNLKWM